MSAFSELIKGHCRVLDLSLDSINERSAMLHFKMESARSQTVFMIDYDGFVEFSVPSGLAFSSAEEIPHVISSVLLAKNAKLKMGAWTIEEIQGKHVYSIMHNIDARLLDQDCFAKIVGALVSQCDEFEGAILEMGGGKSRLRGSDSEESKTDWGGIAIAGLNLLTALLGGPVRDPNGAI
jgi:hypothetical protein